MFNKVKTAVSNASYKVGAKATVAALALGSASAHAEYTVPAEAQSVMDGVSGFATAIINWGWGIVAVVTIGTVGWKLLKKGANKAT
ncbi:major coat protein [Vibrio neptunius]|uniref:Major coat protein n=1 Tax=Vibrio neptunius TaxID=170651 RepID=A0ABS2ZYN4_9VIBR|nr:major coat protein [Vibrio neptunius]MBN3492260.1 hypothetical protein [Vibrio neptunius]MBN3514925.1 hypothetical protein [Vibrio neptunius]MBN3549640.1 hypothetical protein [Vibrio neptunius]MBN3576885.1 hypothetical protein [Vibrio neptunius]MCH9870549.1 hypothetical protein [Vibrio neptunius]